MGLAVPDIPECLFEHIENLVQQSGKFMQLIPFSEPDTKPKVPPNQLSGGLFKAIQRPPQPMGQVYAENGCCRNHKGKGRPDGLGEDQKLIGGYCPFCEREW